MEYKFNFQTEAEKLELIHENKDKYIKEIVHCFDNQYIIFKNVRDGKLMSNADYVRMFIRNDYKVPSGYIFDGFNGALYSPGIPPVYNIPE